MCCTTQWRRAVVTCFWFCGRQSIAQEDLLLRYNNTYRAAVSGTLAGVMDAAGEGAVETRSWNLVMTHEGTLLFWVERACLPPLACALLSLAACCLCPPLTVSCPNDSCVWLSGLVLVMAACRPG